jgi:preprotein translocase subunit SecA
MSLLTKIFGSKNERDIKMLKPLVAKVNSLEPKYQAMSDEELKNQTNILRDRVTNGASLEDIIHEAFAVVREASRRCMNMRHFDVQLMGGAVLFRGTISEMKTGEGKTLTATLPLYLHALSGQGAHLVTVNDYLAARDAREMGVLFNWLGLTVGCIISDMSDEKRQEAYKCDITYGTNNEFAFDYLRDNMKFDLDDYVQRGHNFCIVDEVDSILIDEARTPLLISGPSEGDTSLYEVVNRSIPKLDKVTDFTVDEKARTAILTDAGATKIAKLLNVEDLYSITNTELLHHIHQSLKAHHLFALDVDYVVKEGRVIIVDEFTGRLKDGSRWSDGLHQAVEAKEGVKVKSENQTLASITFQNYFRLYKRLAGMTGTADTEAEEFRKIYNLDVTVIPTNLPMVRDDQADAIYGSREAKLKAIAETIRSAHEKGQPILVGTISIESSEIISRYLTKMNVTHNVLNAKQHQKEAEIIANAGQKGAVTIATNMAGRGTDIKLTEETKKLGGLFIIGTERHESRRIDNQLRGRSGRQGDPGRSKFFLSLEDDLMRIFGSDRIKKFMNTLGMNDDEPIEHKMITNAIAKAQKKVEAHNFEIRKHLLEYDNVMNEQRRVIYRIRREILGDQDNLGFIKDMVDEVLKDLVTSYRPEKKIPLDSYPWEEMNKSFQTLLNTNQVLNALECSEKFQGDLDEYFSKQGIDFLTEKLKSYDDEQIRLACREILLHIFDKHWKDHLLGMDHMKEGINLRAYAQKDPLSEYKAESFNLFELMRGAVKRNVVENIFRVKLYTKEEIEDLKRQHQADLEKQLEAHKRAQAQAEAAETVALVRGKNKVGRNDICPCGSGKKYKQCHGA